MGMRAPLFSVAKRIILILPVLWAVVTLVFLLIHIVPGDPARALAGENASEAQYRAVRSELGLDKPLLTQYFDYWRGLRRGGLGEKPITRHKEFSRITPPFPENIKLAIV